MEIGIIGTGDMGKKLARESAVLGYRVNCTDRLEKIEGLRKELVHPGIYVLDDGHAVSRRSDITFYLVETENIERVVAQYGRSTKKDAIVSSGTSVMGPAVAAFDKYLDPDVNIINWHWLFGPSVNPQGQITAMVNNRNTDSAYLMAKEIFESFKTKIVELPSYQIHDKITADTQAVTHVGLESMGTAWKNAGTYPWENSAYVGGIDNVKILLCLRLYSGKSHVYSGLAIQNPYAREEIMQYAQSESGLFKLMIQEKEHEFRSRIERAGDSVFKNGNSQILLDDKIMSEFSLGLSNDRKPNSHLSLLSMVDSWYKLGINPYENMICQTPLFRLRLGIVECLFRNPDLLEESIKAALFDKSIRGDDLEFHTAVREWSTVIGHGDVAGYKTKFEDTRRFFEPRLEEGKKKSDGLISMLS
ncbi:prephenate dehydrogenase [archaeon]|nr:MAG: prephenate dehydrogenase [archaeon]